MIKKLRALKYVIISAFFCAVIFGRYGKVLALDVPPVPTDIPIVDTTNTLSEEQKNSLANSIAESRAKTSNQIGILMIPSLENDSLEEYSIKVAREWGIGTKDKNNGVLIVIAKNDRKIRIEVGYGLEGALTDAKSSQIIRNVITPEFKKDKYFEGLSAGLQSIQLAIQNEFDPALDNSSTKLNGDFWEFIFFAIFFGLIWVSSILARSKSWWAGGVVGGVLGIIIGLVWGFIITGVVAIMILVALGLLLDRAVSKNYAQRTKSKHTPSWWAGGTYFGGGSSGGGGFGGFGGGGFGGGGSSGSW